MHKIEIKILSCIGLLCLLLVFFIFCINKNQELSGCVIRGQELIEKKTNILKLSDEIAQTSFDFLKSSSLISTTDGLFKNTLKDICKNFHIGEYAV